MTEKSTAWQSRAEFLVLHAVRLAGFSNIEAIADRTDLRGSVISEKLRALEERNWVELFTFADSEGWILTDAGKSRDAELLREEIDEIGVRPALETTAKDFEIINSRLVQVVTDWQLKSPTAQADGRVAVLDELAEIDTSLTKLMAELIEQLPRFGRYPRQFSAALGKARAGDEEWVAGVGRLSCHLVWAELHEDLLSSLGRERHHGEE